MPSIHQHFHYIRVVGVVTCLSLLLLTGCTIPGASAGVTTSVATSTLTPTTPPACPSSGYCAKVPGPNCDSGGAQWLTIEAATVTCATTGMQLSVPGSDKEGGVVFVPPGNTVPISFSVAVTAQVDPSLDGCLSLVTVAHGGSYRYFVCPVIGLWYINLNMQGTTPKELARGTVTTSTAYHIVVTTSGNDRTLTINGTPAGSVSDGTLPTTIGIALTLFNHGSTPQWVVFHDFIYTPAG